MDKSNGIFPYKEVLHKGMKILTHATTWINLKNITQSERSQMQKQNKYSILSPYEKCPEKENLCRQNYPLEIGVFYDVSIMSQ